MWRETPSIDVVTAQKRTGAATRATIHRIASATPEGKEETTPRIGRLDELGAERRVGPVGPGDDRHRHQRDGRHAGVDERHRERPDRDHPLQVARMDVDVGGEVGGRLDPRVGEHRDDRGVDDVDDARVAEEVELVGEAVGVEDDEHADDDHRQLQGDVGEGEEREAGARGRGR